MDILLSLLLAQARVLPEIDRRALDLQARAEALQTRRSPAKAQPSQRRATAASATRPAATASSTAVRRPAKPASAPQRRAVSAAHRPTSIRRAATGALDLSAITAICRAAGNQRDPAGFVATLTRAYALTGAESSSLRTSCAAYLAGRADARLASYGALAN